jgi:acetyl-CoA C-acetyltransferase
MIASIVSTAQTHFGKDERSVGEMMLDVCNQIINNTENLTMDSVDAIYIANFSSSFTNQCHLPAVLASKLRTQKEITRVESACASGGAAFKQAVIAIKSGLYKNVLVIGVEKMIDTPTDTATAIIAQAASQLERDCGATFPSLFALIAQRHSHEFGTGEEHLAKVAVKNHANAFNNPFAQFHKKITLEDVMNSRVVAAPLKLLDCSPISDGAAAVLVSSPEIAPTHSESVVNLVGIGHCVDSIELTDRQRLTGMPSVITAAKKAYAMSNLDPKDINVAEIHDCFTIAELVEIEDLGFCKKGQAKDLVDEGRTEIDGDIPINPSGGLKAKGHPIGTTGISQIVEVVNQLSGRTTYNQIGEAEYGLCCNVGGVGATAVVSIFSR